MLYYLKVDFPRSKLYFVHYIKKKKERKKAKQSENSEMLTQD